MAQIGFDHCLKKTSFHSVTVKGKCYAEQMTDCSMPGPIRMSVLLSLLTLSYVPLPHDSAYNKTVTISKPLTKIWQPWQAGWSHL